MKTTAQILTEARALIDTPEKWTQKTSSRDCKGSPLERATDPNAVCFCSLGALDKAARNFVESDRAYKFLYKLTSGDVSGFNDTHSHSEVMELFNRAISLA